MNKCKCCDTLLNKDNTKYDVCISCYREPGIGCSQCGKVLAGIYYKYFCGECIRNQPRIKGD